MARRANIQGPNIGALLGNVGGAIKRGSIKTLETASLKAKQIEEAEIRRATGGDLRMSGVGRSRGKPGNAKVGVRYDSDKSGEIPTTKIKATGPLHLLERDRLPALGEPEQVAQAGHRPLVHQRRVEPVSLVLAGDHRRCHAVKKAQQVNGTNVVVQ